jgi:hypothetical protein
VDGYLLKAPTFRARGRFFGRSEVLSNLIFRDGRGLGHKGKGTSVMLMPCAPPKVELKNLWWDFRKVVNYIELNREWLTGPMFTSAQY